MKTETSEQTPWQRLKFLYSSHGSRQGTKGVAKLFGVGKINWKKKNRDDTLGHSAFCKLKQTDGIRAEKSPVWVYTTALGLLGTGVPVTDQRTKFVLTPPRNLLLKCRPGICSSAMTGRSWETRGEGAGQKNWPGGPVLIASIFQLTPETESTTPVCFQLSRAHWGTEKGLLHQLCLELPWPEYTELPRREGKEAILNWRN